MSSEVQSRPAATRGGRGAARGGRGGFAGRGSTRRTNGDAKNDDSSLASLEDEGEIGQLKKLYGAKTTLIREMFPDWSEVDVLFALRETDGDENLTVTRIAEGTISQWDEVSKPKKSSSKPKATTAAEAAAARPPRREGAGPDKTRGRANARAVERGGRSARGRSAPAAAAAANGTRTDAPLSVPTEESQAWSADESAPEPTAAAAAAAAPSTTTTTSAAPSSAPAAKTWASMLRQVVVHPPKVVVKPKEAAPAPKAPTDTADSLPTSSTTAPTTAPTTSSAPTADAEPESAADNDATPVVKEAAAPDVAVPVVVVPEVAIAPSKDALTESNLEQVDDDSHPPETDTLHSEAADSWDPRSAASLAGTSTPISASHQQHAAKPAAVGSGYAATATKATDRGAVRTPSYSRRILDQEEAVRMPVGREVDRAAVQFGALNFNGADNEDIDGDREEPETRTQPPDESPVAQPRASLPPVAPPASVPDAFGAQKQAAATPTATSTLPSAPAAAAPVAPPTGPAAQTAAQNTQQYGRYGQAAQESAFGQKPYDAYGQPAQAQAQTSANSQFDNYQGLPSASNTQAQQAPTAYSSAAPNEYSQYFTSDAQSRMPQYNNYYQAYGQQAAQGHQDGTQNNQRSYGGYDSLSQYPQSSGASRFGGAAAATSTAAADAQNSGTSTPNPAVTGQPQSQQQQSAGAQGQHGQQQHQNSQYGSYSNHPYYGSPYYAQYMQYGAFGGQNNFAAPYGGKGGYGNAQHHPYNNMTPQYDQHSSQASGGFGGASSLHRGAGADNSGLGSAGLSDYGRVGAGQSQTGFGGEGSYGRGGASSYQSQAAGQGYGAQQSQVGSQQTGADDLKPYGDTSKGAGAGPSPSGLARPGSATNTQSSQALPPSQSTQQGGYSGYPSHLQQHGAGGLHGNNQSAAGGAGGYGGNQNHGNNPYIGAYGGHNAQHGGHGGQGGFGSNNYYSNQQQQRGWGGNYH